MLWRDYKAKEADTPVYRVDTPLVAELRRPRAPGRRGIGPVEDPHRGAQDDRRLAGGDHAGDADDAGGA